jgi:2-polyprenyl-3-methyl-5-hydroxy-6-metoxy-1,4-benzoquinol methylase
MSNRENKKINVADIMAKIREEIAQRRKSESVGSTGLNSLDKTNALTRSAEENIIKAKQNADISGRQILLTQYPRSIRWLVKLVGKIVLLLNRIITNPQTRYNQHVVQSLHSITENLNHLNYTVNSLVQLESDLHDQKRSLIQLERRVYEAIKPERTKQIRNQIPEKVMGNFLDTFYYRFTNEFRGHRQEIKEKQKAYIPYLDRAYFENNEKLILDLGCGRGEWLDLLHEEGFLGRGIDINGVFIEECRKNGHDVIEADVIEYLRELPEDSIGAITSFHLIEHLTFSHLIELIDETVRVLKPNGLAIFETPNPGNLQVGARDFYLDPTHRNPLPAPTVKFILESRGLSKIEILRLNPDPVELDESIETVEIIQRLTHLLYGPRDYAAIGYKV